MFLFNFDKTNNLKGFKKYLGEEDKLQRSVVEYLKWEYPEAIFTHVPNEGRRTPFERNQGAWFSHRHRLQRVLDRLDSGKEISMVSRPPAAAPAVGMMKLHLEQQNNLIEEALK